MSEAEVSEAVPTDPEFWDERYGRSERIWSGNPNVALVRQAADLTPGRALDLGCGEGADAVWLARQGWQVTAVDVSQVALARAAGHAAEAGLAQRIVFAQHDLAADFPAGRFDLVSAQFLYSATGNEARETMLRHAAAAVAPGGVLLVEGHCAPPAWEQRADGPDQEDGHGHEHGEAPTSAADHDHQREHQHSHDHQHGDGHPRHDFPTPDQVLATLALPEGGWEVLVNEEHERIQNDPEGRPTVRRDSTLKIKRLR